MSIEHLRNLGKHGVITDIDPYDLPIEAFSAGVNIRFRNNKITSGPVFRSVYQVPETDPRFACSASPATGLDLFFVGYKNGQVKRFSSNTETDFTLSGYTTSAVEAAWSSTVLGAVVYINRADRAPWYLRASDVAFQDLSKILLTTTAATATSSNTLTFTSVPATIVAGMVVTDKTTGLSVGTIASTTSTTVVLVANAANAVGSGDIIAFTNGASQIGQWDTAWSCKVLRSCAGALVALNVTKGATSYQTMVKTSSIPTSGTVPVSWDQTASNAIATENQLTKMDGPITDGCSLGQDLIVYGLRECWRMHADNSTFIYSYEKLPFNKGALNVNCSFEYEGKNFVFGLDDIWMHDGNSERSLCDEKTRDFIFGSLNLSQASKCFVAYNPKLKEMYFAYVSGDPYVNYLNGVNGCNRQAVLNLTNMTWTFDDLPSCFFATNTNVSNILTYATVTTTYTTIGGSYQDQEDGFKRAMVYVGESVAGYSLVTSIYGFDLYGQGSILPYAVDTNATAPRYLERTGLDLDELNIDLRGYKTLSSVYPQARLGSGAAALQMACGASDTYNGVITYLPYQSYDGITNNKLDFNVAGRWLGYKLLFADYKELTITGFDFDLKVTGQRLGNP
jgi:hypothetical protein